MNQILESILSFLTNIFEKKPIITPDVATEIAPPVPVEVSVPIQITAVVSPVVSPIIISAPQIQINGSKLYNGIDISSVQEAVNFNNVVAAGNSFIMSKCYTGNDGMDPTYKNNIIKAKEAGLVVGSYNFLYPLQTDPSHPNRDAAGQAKLHFSHCITEFVCADLEWPENQDWAKWNVSGQFINDWTLTYLETYTQLSGRKPIVYTYPYFAKSVSLSSDFAQYQLWIASYVKNKPDVPKPWGADDWIMWQTGLGKLSNGAPVDVNVAKDLSMFDKA